MVGKQCASNANINVGWFEGLGLGFTLKKTVAHGFPPKSPKAHPEKAVSCEVSTLSSESPKNGVPHVFALPGKSVVHIIDK